MKEAVIEAIGLTKSYGAARGIEDVSFTVRRGETFGFLGPNGAGKTTTIRLLLDLIRPTVGIARVLGLDAQRQALAVRRRVGYLPGELAFDGALTGEEFLAYSGNLRGGVDRERVLDLVARFDVPIGRRIRELSRGNRQKLGLVAAFMHDPEVLLLDEPTSGLDPLMQQAFYGLVREATARGRTVFLSSHVLSEVEAICDRVAIIREGRIVAVDDVRAILARAVRRVRLRFDRPAPSAGLRDAPGVEAAAIEGEVLACVVRGAVGPLVREAVAAGGLLDVETERPSLEDAFLQYYEEVEA